MKQKKDNRGGKRDNSGRPKEYIDKRLTVSIKEGNEFIFDVEDRSKFINDLLSSHRKRE